MIIKQIKNIIKKLINNISIKYNIKKYKKLKINSNNKFILLFLKKVQFLILLKLKSLFIIKFFFIKIILIIFLF